MSPRSVRARALLCLAPLIASLPSVLFPEEVALPEDRVTSRVEVTEARERILVQEAYFDAPVEELWWAHTTEEGWTSWSSPVARIDLRVGGTIRTHYGAGAKIGDPGTNTLHIVNYVPNRVLTLRADLSENWPEIMKQDADKLSNVILFDDLGEGRCRIRSYGIGYQDDPEYDELMKFFMQANDSLYETLIQALEG